VTASSRRATSSTSGSCTRSSTSSREPAEQVWPAFWTTELTITGAAASRSASAKTMFGDLPPSSSVTGTQLSAAAFVISVPTSDDPVNAR
jgi:hypothetical protein